MGDYRLDDLGWYQFERLCQTLLKVKYGASVEAWGGTGDWGRDAYASGQLAYPNPNIRENGPFLFQCKFVKNANSAGARPAQALMSSVRAEIERIRERTEARAWEAPRFYTLLTNAPLSPRVRGEISTAMTQVMPQAQITTLGYTDICALLDDSPVVRISYPQILGLSDLEQLLRSAVASDVVERTTLALEEAQSLAAVFVATAAYQRTLGVLGQHRFAVLTGPPEVGKTAIARMVALGRVSSGWEAYDCLEPADFFRTYQRDRRQVFVVDDAFGSTEYRPERAADWAHSLEKIFLALSSRHLLVITSRPAPLKHALELLHVASPSGQFPKPGEVQVNVADLRLSEKAQMLYRHAKAARLGEDARALVRENAEVILGSPHFTPLRIHRFVAVQLPEIAAEPTGQQEDLVVEAVRRNLQVATRPFQTSFNALDDELKAVLVVLLNSERGPVKLDEMARLLPDFLGRQPSRSVASSVALLEDHFLEVSDAGQLREVTWVHPSVRDIVIDYLMAHDAERARFLRSTMSSGLILAISSAGGSEGERRFPLIASENDRSLARERLVHLISTGDDELRLDLLRGLQSAIGEESALATDWIPSVAASALEELSEYWGSHPAPLESSVLETYYQLSVAARVMIPSPPLEPTWDAALGAFMQVVDSGDIWNLEPVSNLLDLADLLAEYEPRFLRVSRFHAIVPPKLTPFFDSIEEQVLSLEELDEEEDEHIYVEEVDASYDEPVEPSSQEEEERVWLGSVLQIIQSIRSHVQLADERVDNLVARIDAAFAVRQARKERRDDWEMAEPYDDDSSYRGSYHPTAESFDIATFFSDL